MTFLREVIFRVHGLCPAFSRGAQCVRYSESVTQWPAAHLGPWRGPDFLPEELSSAFRKVNGDAQEEYINTYFFQTTPATSSNPNTAVTMCRGKEKLGALMHCREDNEPANDGEEAEWKHCEHEVHPTHAYHPKQVGHHGVNGTRHGRECTRNNRR